MDHAHNSPLLKRELLRLQTHRDLLISMLRRAVSISEESVRLKLLFASVVKVWRMGRAVRLLAAEAFTEEILGLSRTMAEVTINAAYLQHAEDEEIDRFQHFDTQAMYRHAVRLRPHISRTLSDEELNKIEAVVKSARTLTGRKDNDASWSKRTLLQRAEYSDRSTRLNLMNQLALTAYAYGNSAVHGTFDALHAFVSGLENAETFSEEQRQEGLFLALSSVNFVYCTMCFYLNSTFGFRLDDEIVAAGKLEAHD